MQPFNWHEMWAPTWNPGTVVVRAAIIYLALQVMSRIVGRKELGRYSTSDIVVLHEDFGDVADAFLERTGSVSFVFRERHAST